MVEYLKTKFEEMDTQRREDNKKFGPSCTCGDVNCICCCEAGGLDGEGNTTNQPCDIKCKKHGDKCKIRIM